MQLSGAVLIFLHKNKDIILLMDQYSPFFKDIAHV